MFEKIFQGSCKLPQAHEKVCNGNETKNDACKNIIDGRRAFIRYAQKTRPMDINQLQIDDC